MGCTADRLLQLDRATASLLFFGLACSYQRYKRKDRDVGAGDTERQTLLEDTSQPVAEAALPIESERRSDRKLDALDMVQLVVVKFLSVFVCLLSLYTQWRSNPGSSVYDDDSVRSAV